MISFILDIMLITDEGRSKLLNPWECDLNEGRSSSLAHVHQAICVNTIADDVSPIGTQVSDSMGTRLEFVPSKDVLLAAGM